MNNPERQENTGVTHLDAAPQREPAAQTESIPQRHRGPHPLPVFLAAVAVACKDDPARLRRVLAGLRRYQAAPPALPRAKKPEIARIGGVTLRDHGGTGAPVVIVPSLINPPDIIDLAPGNSLAAALAASGLRVLSIDWGDTEALDLDALVTRRLVPLVESFGTPVSLIGYCLGGSLAIAAAALLGPRIHRLALLATPWHFAGYDDDARAGFAAWWAGAAPVADTLGCVPIDLLQPAFWALDPDALAAKFAACADADPPEAFVRLEDWANGGVPLSIAATRQLVETLFAEDASGDGRWQAGGQAIDAGTLTLPILDIIAGRDRIVPPAAALSANGPGTPLVLDAGHVGMVVGRRAPELLWAPLAAWLQL